MKRQKYVALMSPVNGHKMLQALNDTNAELKAYLKHHEDQCEAGLIARVNMVLYNMAQSRGVSLWDLCFKVAPRWEATEPKIDYDLHNGSATVKIDYDLHLVPIVIDWEHGPSYWEKKYCDLKERVARLVDDVEEVEITKRHYWIRRTELCQERK